MKNEKIERLTSEISKPCVTISMNTHRTHPANAQDTIGLKNLCKEAETRLIAEFDKKAIAPLLEKLEQIPSEIDVNYNLDSLHIFLSNNTKEIIKSLWNVKENKVYISDTFAIRSLIKEYNRSENYLILLLSQSGVKLFEALNDTIIGEILNDAFPFAENPHFNTEPQKLSDPKAADNMVREFLNEVDKAVVKVHNSTSRNCVVICTEDNYSRLMQVADKPNVYLGYANIDYNHIAKHQISAQAWEIIKEKQKQHRTEAINEMKEAVGQSKVITDLSDIYRAVKEGKGDLLIAHNSFNQAVKMNNEFSFDLVEDATQPDVIDDITSEIAWEVISKKGRVVFTDQDDIKTLGNIALKVRY
jgi:hypothetical protein